MQPEGCLMESCVPQTILIAEIRGFESHPEPIFFQQVDVSKTIYFFLYKIFTSENYIAGGLPPYLNGRSVGLQGQGLRSNPYSPWAAGALGRSGVSGLAVKELVWNGGGGHGFKPTWSRFFPASGCFEEIYFFLFAKIQFDTGTCIAVFFCN